MEGQATHLLAETTSINRAMMPIQEVTCVNDNVSMEQTIKRAQLGHPQRWFCLINDQDQVRPLPQMPCSGDSLRINTQATNARWKQEICFPSTQHLAKISASFLLWSCRNSSTRVSSRSAKMSQQICLHLYGRHLKAYRITIVCEDW